MSPYLPVSAQQIADAAVDAANVGAAIVHLHARKPDDGQPSFWSGLCMVSISGSLLQPEVKTDSPARVQGTRQGRSLLARHGILSS